MAKKKKPLQLAKLGKLVSILFFIVFSILGVAAITITFLFDEMRESSIFAMYLGLIEILVIPLAIISGGVASSGVVSKYFENKYKQEEKTAQQEEEQKVDAL